MLKLKTTKKQNAFTLIEMMVTILISSIVLLGIGGVLADAHRGYNRMYSRVHGDVVNDAYAARLTFDKVCRQARNGSALVSVDNESLIVQYYSTPNVTGDADLEADMEAYFHLNDADELILEKGPIGGDPTTTQTIARNVTEVKFAEIHSKSVQMTLTLSLDGEHSITVSCGAIMHN